MRKNLVFFHPNLRDDGCKKTLEIYTNFLAKKFNVTLITNTSNLSLLKNINPKIRLLNLNNFLFRNFIFINQIYCLISLIKYMNRDNIIFSLDGYFILLFLKFLKFKFNLFIRIANPIPVNDNKLKIISTNPGSEIGILDLFFLKYSDVTILYSKLYKNYLEKKYKLKNILIIKNYFKKEKVTNRNKNRYSNIFFIGRLVDIKDPFFFLKNLIVISYNYKIKIHIVGDGPLLNDLKKISTQKNIPVKFYGHIKNPFKKFHNKIDIFCLTSKHDGTPNVLGEAVSKKIPCIAPKDVGCVNEILDNGNLGTIYKKGNSKDFQRKIIYMINNCRAVNKKAERAYKGLDRYNLDNTLKKLEKKIFSFI